jgi:hypothetical protein
MAGAIAFLKLAWKISSTNLVMCSSSGSSKGGITVEDQKNLGKNLNRDDEDVEGHAHKNAPSQHKLASDEGEDVEGHMNKGSNVGAHKAANDEGDDDDVEAHMHKNAVNQGMHKA